jgi:hypothetical protein
MDATFFPQTGHFIALTSIVKIAWWRGEKKETVRWLEREVRRRLRDEGEKRASARCSRYLLCF